MFNISALASSVLDSLDSVAKDTLEEHPKVSATALRKNRKIESGNSSLKGSDFTTPVNTRERNLTESSVRSHSSHDSVGDILKDSSNHGTNSVEQVPLVFIIFTLFYLCIL
jgi:hypothetical protein